MSRLRKIHAAGLALGVIEMERVCCLAKRRPARLRGAAVEAGDYAASVNGVMTQPHLEFSLCAHDC